MHKSNTWLFSLSMICPIWAPTFPMTETPYNTIPLIFHRQSNPTKGSLNCVDENQLDIVCWWNLTVTNIRVAVRQLLFVLSYGQSNSTSCWCCGMQHDMTTQVDYMMMWAIYQTIADSNVVICKTSIEPMPAKNEKVMPNISLLLFSNV